MKSWLSALAVISVMVAPSAWAFELSAGIRVGAVHQQGNVFGEKPKDEGFVYGVESTILMPVGSNLAVGFNTTLEKYAVSYNKYNLETDTLIWSANAIVGYRSQYLGEYQADESLLYLKVGYINADMEIDIGTRLHTPSEGSLQYGIGYRYTNDKDLYSAIEVMRNSTDTSLMGENVSLDNTQLMVSFGYRF